MSLNNNNNLHGSPFWRTGLNKLRALIYRSPLYMVTLKKKKNLEIAPLPGFLTNADQGRGKAILSGDFPFAGRTYKNAQVPWTTAQDDAAWQRHIHGFYWLDDLLACEDAQGLVEARRLIKSWIDLHGVWTPLAWRADVMGERLVSWMKNAAKITATADEDFIRSFNTSLSLQSSHLSRSYLQGLSGYHLLRALRGQLYVGLFLVGFTKSADRALRRLGDEFNAQILADGGHISRNPQVLFETLKLALELMDVFEKVEKDCPKAIRLSIDRMAPMVRTLRHGDGGLALFHGAQEGDGVEIDAVLDKTENQGKPLSDARHSGFQRIEAGHTILLMDVAAPPSIDQNPAGHGAPLSFELSCGDERLFVNCGSVLGGDQNWQSALAATAAHNTLVVDDKNAVQLHKDGGVVSRDIHVESKRFEENGEVLIDANHDAYKESFGLIHHRSVYLNKSGTDMRVEDKLIGTGGNQFAISLHLHPDAHASIVQDGQAALIKTHSGAGWHLRAQGGKLEMRESIYMPNPGQVRHTDQILIQGPLRGDGADVKWRLSRVGGV